MSQLSFLDQPSTNSHLARATDPATSQQAARETQKQLSTLQARMVQVIGELGPMTACEAGVECARRFDGLAETYRKRATECVRLGALEIVGTRNCRVTGKPAHIYGVTQ